MTQNSISDNELFNLSFASNPFPFEMALKESNIDQISRIFIEKLDGSYRWLFCTEETKRSIVRSVHIKFSDEHISWLLAEGCCLLQLLRRKDLLIPPEALEQIYTSHADKPQEFIDFALGNRSGFHVGVRWCHLFKNRPDVARGVLERNEPGVPSAIVNRYLNGIHDGSFQKGVQSALKNQSFQPDAKLIKRVMNEAPDRLKFLVIPIHSHLMRRRDILKAMKSRSTHLRNALDGALLLKDAEDAASSIPTSPTTSRPKPRF